MWSIGTGGETVKITEVVYITQSVKDLLSISRPVSKGATMGATQDKKTINKNGVIMILDASK